MQIPHSGLLFQLFLCTNGWHQIAFWTVFKWPCFCTLHQFFMLLFAQIMFLFVGLGHRQTSNLFFESFWQPILGWNSYRAHLNFKKDMVCLQISLCTAKQVQYIYIYTLILFLFFSCIFDLFLSFYRIFDLFYIVHIPKSVFWFHCQKPRFTRLLAVQISQNWLNFKEVIDHVKLDKFQNWAHIGWYAQL